MECVSSNYPCAGVALKIIRRVRGSIAFEGASSRSSSPFVDEFTVDAKLLIIIQCFSSPLNFVNFLPFARLCLPSELPAEDPAQVSTESISKPIIGSILTPQRESTDEFPPFNLGQDLASDLFPACVSIPQASTSNWHRTAGPSTRHSQILLS